MDVFPMKDGLVSCLAELYLKNFRCKSQNWLRYQAGFSLFRTIDWAHLILTWWI